jgi:prepilin-type N-terminal cleavage/methylation domain-containing protein
LQVDVNGIANMNRPNRRQAGFTLVEIAIVLVIIGLLLGGILKGQEMITQAKIKNVIADMSGVSAAMYGYQDRYKALPGDDGKSTRWSTVTTAGNANGIIEGTYNADPTSGTPAESVQFWNHLRLAGFISGSGLTQPFNAVSGKLGVQTGDGTNSTPVKGVLGETAASKHFTGLMLCSSNLPDKVAISVDAQMDDGDGKKGSVRAKSGGGAPALASEGAADAFSEDGVSFYVVCRLM